MNPDTLLLRQVHPNWIQKDSVSLQVFTATSQTFKPTPKDEAKLSVYNGEKFTGQSSFEHYTADGKQSGGVLAVSHTECIQNTLTAVEDNDPFDGHTYIDYTGKTQSEIEKIAKKMRTTAITRGWLYMAEQ